MPGRSCAASKDAGHRGGRTLPHVRPTAASAASRGDASGRESSPSGRRDVTREHPDGDDPSGNLGAFVEVLYCGWITARQAAESDPDETARLLLDRMENGPPA